MTVPTLRSLSLGAGVQSTTLSLLAVEGAIPRPDVAIFADTGWEPARVYTHLDRLEEVLTAAGIEVHRVKVGNLRKDALDPVHAFTALPFFTRNDDGTLGMGQRQCTHQYKLVPINRKVRELLGAPAPHFRRVKAGRVAEQQVGFSLDEVWRVNDDVANRRYLHHIYPLIEMRWTRRDCERWLASRGWTPVKSSCIGCPFHGNRQWRELRDTNPVEWADAVEFDHAIRRLPGLEGEAFLHASRVPLDEAPIDLVTRKEWKDRQVDLFDELEEGQPLGCSPYGCRTATPA